MGFGTLINDIVYKISGRVLSSSGLYIPSDYQYDYALGGTPFLSATSDTRPDLEGPVEQRKQQFDNYKDPGEYSLNQWWLRSQTSFAGGAGVVYQDPDTQGAAKNIRYRHSLGVDPFSDLDLLQLLKSSVETGAADSDTDAGAAIFANSWEGTFDNDVIIAKGRTIYRYEVLEGSLGANGSVTLPTSGVGTPRIEDGIVVIDSPNSSVPSSNGHFYVYYLDSGSAANTGIYHMEGLAAVRQYITTTGPVRLSKARGLLAVGVVNEFYMLDPYVAANTALPAANAAVPVDQVIVGAVDGPDSVYVAANDAFNGFIYKATFDTNGVVNGLSLTAVLPNGERINSIGAYVNTNLIITTETGVRVGVFTGGSVQYGPNLIPVPKEEFSDPSVHEFADSGFGRIAFHGSLAFITTLGDPQHDGANGLMAIDLGTVIDDSNTGASINAYSTWLYPVGNTDRVVDVTVTVDGRLIYTTGFSATSDVYLEHKTELVEQGYLDTGRCRFNTVEPKLFKYMSIRTPSVLEGELLVSVIDQNDGVTNYQTFGPTLDPGTNDISTPVPAGPQNWISLRFTLRRGATDATIGAKLDSWQIKALPGTLKQRKIVRQFLCFNQEKDKAGQIISGDTLSLTRLTQVRQMCQRGDTVTFQDLVNNISDQVVIDDYQFTMLAPPGPNGENYGGYLTVHMRTVADNVPPLSFAGVDEED